MYAKLGIILFAAAAAYGLAYLLLLNAAMPKQTKLVISGVISAVVFVGFWTGTIRV